MEPKRFLNQTQPQTLVIGTLLLYFNAAMLVLSLSIFSLLGLALAAGMAFGAYGIANERKWGYKVAVVAVVVNLALLLILAGSAVFRFPGIISLLFDGALVALLLHPESRDYQRVWFR